MSGKATITYYDLRGRPTSISLTTASIDGASFPTLEAAAQLLRDDFDALGLSAQSTLTLTQPDDEGTPADRGGVRGNKALIKWFSPNEGDGGQYGSNEIGCVDPAQFTVVGDKMILQGALYDSIKLHFDDFVTTENGNAVEVYEIEFVSRNL